MKSLAIGFLLALVGCTPTEPAVSYVVFWTPAIYDTLWKQIDECSGIVRPNTATYAIGTGGDIAKFWDGKQLVAGAYFPEQDLIVLAPFTTMDWFTEAERYAVVRHEMLHAHLIPLGIKEHPPEYFVTKCGALVAH